MANSKFNTATLEAFLSLEEKLSQLEKNAHVWVILKNSQKVKKKQ